MNEHNHTSDWLEALSQILIRCAIMGAILLLFWWGILQLAGDWVYDVHSRFFPMPRQQFEVLHYAGMMTTKAAVGLFFLIPYIAIRLVMKKRAAGAQ